MDGEPLERRVSRWDGEADVADHLRSTIRISCGYAGTVLWFVGGPVDYPDSGLSDQLCDDLAEWERVYDEAMVPDFAWGSIDKERAHSEEGLRLARVVAEEVGDAFEVEVDDPDSSDSGRIKGVGQGANPAAAAAFRELVRQDLEVAGRIQRARENGAQLYFTHLPPDEGGLQPD
ncbi:hypothetical protein ACFSBZ_05925 [Amnibacterium flavum]|uniref:Uncharacterized protein n=1 Tax=Amnibacterium flavum TaxID=2173173 RepID=A0A2V1HV57_9MICO|nr:hypothetical protein [Amnibacterium flavum]PVZ93994.1 hypothetical protein DDQ50_09555 [Amnibacterium flavum]